MSNEWGSNWGNMEVRLSGNLDINIRLSSNINLDINIWLSKRVQVSVCYGRIIMSSIYSGNWCVSISSDRLSSITISIWTSGISSMSYGGSSGVSISSGVGVTISGCWDNSSTSRGYTGKDCNKGIHIKFCDATTV